MALPFHSSPLASTPRLPPAFSGDLLERSSEAAAFSIPLALFMLWQQKAFVDYLQSADLIKEMARKDQDAQQGNIMFKNYSEGLAIVDHSGVILKANEAFQSMLGIGGTTGVQAANLKNAF